MIDNLNSDIDTLDHYNLGDQPITCGICGTRTSFYELVDGYQKHSCLNVNCKYKFITAEFIE